MKLCKKAVMMGPQKPFVIEEEALAPLPKGFVLIRVVGAGICGGDTHRYSGSITREFDGREIVYPCTIGHQVTGVVEELGEGVSESYRGKHVGLGGTGMPDPWSVLFCGGFRSYIQAPIGALIEIPEDIPLDEATCLVDAYATSYHSTKAANIRLGETVVVLGVGDLGSAVIEFSKLSGAIVIAVDVREEKLEMAKTLGADYTVNVQKNDLVNFVKGTTNGLGADVSFEVAGKNETTIAAMKVLRYSGRAFLIGATDNPITEFATMPYNENACFSISKALTLQSAFGFTQEDIRAVVALRARGLLNTKLGLKRLPMSQINDGFRGKIAGEYHRVVLDPHN